MNSVMQAITDNVLIPIVAILGATLVLVLESCLKKVADSIVNKNAMSDLEKEAATRKKLLDTIASCVEAAVGSNMQLADLMKSNGSLTEEQIHELNESAKKIIYAGLPTSLTDEDGALMKIIGGPEKLEALIVAMMEQYVYEYKIKKSTAIQVIQAEDVASRSVKATTTRKRTTKKTTDESK